MSVENVELSFEEDGRFLVLRLDLEKTLRPTRQGKSMLIASTFGNLQLWHDGKPHPQGIKVNLSCFRLPTDDEKRGIEEAEAVGRDPIAAFRRKLGLPDGD